MEILGKVRHRDVSSIFGNGFPSRNFLILRCRGLEVKKLGRDAEKQSIFLVSNAVLGERIGDSTSGSQLRHLELLKGFPFSWGFASWIYLQSRGGDWNSEKWLIIPLKVKNLSLLLSHHSTMSLSTQDHQIFVIRYLVTCPFITILLYITVGSSEIDSQEKERYSAWDL